MTSHVILFFDLSSGGSHGDVICFLPPLISRLGGVLETAEACVSFTSYATKIQRQDCTEPGALERKRVGYKRRRVCLRKNLKEKDDDDANSGKDAKGAKGWKNSGASYAERDKVCDGGDGNGDGGGDCGGDGGGDGDL